MEKKSFYSFQAKDGSIVYVPVGSVKAIITDIRVTDQFGKPVFTTLGSMVTGDGYQILTNKSTAISLLKEVAGDIKSI